MTHQEIIEKHQLTTENLNDFFGSLTQEQFTKAINDGWSPAEHVAHLIIGHKILGKALSIPKTALALRFGKTASNNQTESYEVIRDSYRTSLSKGFKAPQEFVPKQDKMILDSSKATQKLQETSVRFIETLTKWDDKSIDKYLLPNPALGKKLTIREMLYFNLYHSLHHRNNVAQDLGFQLDWLNL